MFVGRLQDTEWADKNSLAWEPMTGAVETNPTEPPQSRAWWHTESWAPARKIKTKPEHPFWPLQSLFSRGSCIGRDAIERKPCDFFPDMQQMSKSKWKAGNTSQTVKSQHHQKCGFHSNCFSSTRKVWNASRPRTAQILKKFKFWHFEPFRGGWFQGLERTFSKHHQRPQKWLHWKSNGLVPGPRWIHFRTQVDTQNGCLGQWHWTTIQTQCPNNLETHRGPERSKSGREPSKWLLKPFRPDWFQCLGGTFSAHNWWTKVFGLGGGTGQPSKHSVPTTLKLIAAPNGRNLAENPQNGFWSHFNQIGSRASMEPFPHTSWHQKRLSGAMALDNHPNTVPQQPWNSVFVQQRVTDYFDLSQSISKIVSFWKYNEKNNQCAPTGKDTQATYLWGMACTEAFPLWWLCQWGPFRPQETHQCWDLL